MGPGHFIQTIDHPVIGSAGFDLHKIPQRSPEIGDMVNGPLIEVRKVAKIPVEFLVDDFHEPEHIGILDPGSVRAPEQPGLGRIGGFVFGHVNRYGPDQEFLNSGGLFSRKARAPSF